MELVNCKDIYRIANPYVAKCILLGDSGIGKSTLIKILTTGIFDNTYDTTIGIDFATKNITLSDEQIIKLQIWDTAGQEKFRSIINSYLRDVHIAFLVFDITNIHSWENLKEWKQELENYSTHDGIPLIFLIATKSDLKNHVITEKEIKNRANEWKCNYFITSCKEQGANNKIKQIFFKSADMLNKLIFTKHNNDEIIPTSFYDFKDYQNMNINQSKENKWCCFQ